MSEPPTKVAEALVAAIHSGNISALGSIIAIHPGIASAPLGGGYGSRTALHVVTDWPGYWPNGPQIAQLLIEAGADPNARKPGEETPLHWAASSDDAHVAAVLIDAGADIYAPDGSIGTPLANAVGYGCWEVARLLLAHGARGDTPWEAAALGQLEQLDRLLGDDPPPDEVSQAFWHACAGGQRRAAEYLLARGADLNWVPEYAKGTPLDAARGEGTQRKNLVGWLRERGASTTDGDS